MSFLETKGRRSHLFFKQFEFILRDEFGKPRLDPQGKEIVVIGPSPQYKYGFEIPKNYKDAERLDRNNGNNDWKNANKLEYSPYYVIW